MNYCIGIPKGKIKVDNLIQWILACGIFCNYYIEFCCIAIALILVVNRKSQMRAKVGCIILLSAIFIYSSISIYFLGYSYSKFIQQFILLLLFVITYDIIFNKLKYDIYPLFEKYIKVACFIALLGIFQLLIYFFMGINIFEPIYHKSTIEFYPRVIRITSIMDEAGYLSIALTPAIVYAIFRGYIFNRKFIIIDICFLFTWGAVSFFIVILAVVYKLIRNLNRYKIMGVLGICCGFFILLQNNELTEKNNGSQPGVVKRFNDTFKGFTELDPNNFEVLNLSSYAFLTNVWVAIHAPNRISGTGLGTHEKNYTQVYKSTYQYYGLNSKDGYSFFNRAFSEFGVIGCILIIVFLIKNFDKRNLINIACLFILLSFLLKGGHYVRYGFIFWCYLYYYSGRSLATH